MKIHKRTKSGTFTASLIIAKKGELKRSSTNEEAKRHRSRQRNIIHHSEGPKHCTAYHTGWPCQRQARWKMPSQKRPHAVRTRLHKMSRTGISIEGESRWLFVGGGRAPGVTAHGCEVLLRGEEMF